MRESFQLTWSVQPEAFRQMTLEICGFHGGAYESYLLRHDKPPYSAEICQRLRSGRVFPPYDGTMLPTY
jgi:hypothetical protein